MRGVSLLWRILFATSVAVTVVFALTGLMVQQYAASVSQHSLEQEIRTSLKAYESLWGARVHSLTVATRIISSMSDVRSAFSTRDRATIRDTAEQLWSQVSEQDATFLVVDPEGITIASLGGDPSFAVDPALLHSVQTRFPNQVSGYVTRGGRLFFVVFTPVYVQAVRGQALLNILLVAFDIDSNLAATLKTSTNGTDFAFVGMNGVVASTLPLLTPVDLTSGQLIQGSVRRVNLHGSDYLLLGTDLRSPLGDSIGQLFIIRSFSEAEAVLSELQRNVMVFWAIAIMIAVMLTFLLARRILGPVRRLDRAASEVIGRNYDYRVPVETNDELGRLAASFNAMCDSIRSAREELIRQEQIATIGRLSTSIVHDLRNPLAAIYGGAEMLVDADLSPEQSRRLAANIYSATRHMQELLQELLDVSASKTRPFEPCKLCEVVAAATDSLSPKAELQAVSIVSEIPERISVIGDRDRLERVFLNLMDNALDAMPDGGTLRVSAREMNGEVLIEVEDSGKGIPEEILSRLFQPFASFGKKNGLGLGLALSRQTILDHRGDLWTEKRSGTGARFLIRLPIVDSGGLSTQFQSIRFGDPTTAQSSRRESDGAG